jgi:hypothetical protein
LLYTFSTLNTLEWYFLVWPNRPDLLAKITGLGHSVQEYLNSCFTRLCSFNPSDVENTYPLWHAFGSWCVSLCRAKFWLVEYAFPQVEHTKAIVCKNVNTSYTTIFFNNTFVHEQKNWKYAKRKLYLCLS